MRLALLACVLVPMLASARDDAKAPVDQAHALINSFGVMCRLEAPDFDHLVAKATAMRMKVLDDRTSTTPKGEHVLDRAWIGMLTTGPFALRAEQMIGPKGIVTSCAVEGPVPDVDAFRDIVIQTHHLNPAQQPQMAEGARTYYWDNFTGDGSTLIMRDMERPTAHFVQVKLVNMVKAVAP